ncbi:MAG: hypothetical protein AB8B55_23505 [Mariniblastus sp.]
MAIPKKLLQIKLSTWLLSMLVVALVIIFVSNRMADQAKIQLLEQELESYRQHLPEYDIARQLADLKSELREARRHNGNSSPVVNNLVTKISVLEREKETAAARAMFKP